MRVIMWNSGKKNYQSRMDALKPYFQKGKLIDSKDIVIVLAKAIHSGDRVCFRGG